MNKNFPNRFFNFLQNVSRKSYMIQIHVPVKRFPEKKNVNTSQESRATERAYLISSLRKTSLLLYKLLTMRSMRRLTWHRQGCIYYRKLWPRQRQSMKKGHSTIPQLGTHISRPEGKKILQQLLIHIVCPTTNPFSSLRIYPSS